MNTEYVAPAPFEIDRAAPMCQNYKHGVQTQVSTTFRPVSATDQEVGSNHCPDEKGTERKAMSVNIAWKGQVATIAPMKRGLKAVNGEPTAINRPGSNHCPDEKGTESLANGLHYLSALE